MNVGSWGIHSVHSIYTVRIHRHTCTPIHSHTVAHTSAYMCMQSYRHVYTNTSTCVYSQNTCAFTVAYPHIHTHADIPMHTYIRKHMCTYMCPQIHIRRHIHSRKYTHTTPPTETHRYTHILPHMHICVHAHMSTIT